MDAKTPGSITHWLGCLREGESVAAQELWNRYFSQLVEVARSRLRNSSGECGDEDIALSVMNSVMLGLKRNRFPDLVDRTGLWPLLVTITARKSTDELRRQLALKRSSKLIEQIADLQAIVGPTPRPEFAVEVGDELDRLVREFDDPMLRRIAELKLACFTNEEIAKQLSISLSTVVRKLNRIRQEWEADV